MERRYVGTNFVTGLRAYAAMGVVLIHCGGAGLRRLGTFGNDLADLGGTGVYVFFVISGFSLAASYQKLDSLGEFLVRRVMRLAPTYYAFLLIAMCLLQLSVTERNHWATAFEAPFDLYNLLIHLLFLGFLDYRVNNSVIGVEWSLSVEMFWYLLMPSVLMLVGSSRRRMSWTLAAALLIYIAQKLIVDAAAGKTTGHFILQWSPLTYAPAFMLGVAAFQLRDRGKLLSKARANRCIGVVITLLLSQCFFSLMDIRLFIPLLTCLVLISSRDDTGIASVLFNNRFAVFLGTISYSIYLWHPLVIQGLETQGIASSLGQGPAMFLTVSAVTIFLALITYHWIEIPTSRWGRNWMRRWSSSKPSLARGAWRMGHAER